MFLLSFSSEACEYFLGCVLEDLGCCVNSKHEALVSSESDWWYPDERSNLLKTVAPLRSATRSSMVDIRCFSRLTALLASRMSTHILT